MIFSQHEKLAVLKALEKIAKADDQLMEQEMEYLLKAASFLAATPVDIEESKEMTMKEASATLTAMDEDRKSVVLDMMIQLAATDGYIDQREMREALRAFMKIESD